MTYGTGPQALVDHIEESWQASRTGREDVPRIAPGPIRENRGVIVFENREEIAVNHSVHDLIHCYHPQASGLTFSDAGYDEENVVEDVQIDVEVTDRSDPDTGERLVAKDRLVGDRSSAGFPSDEEPPYPGLFGELKYCLELARRGLDEWDVARVSVVNMHLGNSNANVSVDVGLEHIASNTVV